jgi:gliding motility-associated-like protein
MAIVKNTGKIPLSGVYLTDSLNKMFPKNISFIISSKPAVNAGSNLAPNQNFDGISDYKLIVPNSSTIFEAGRTDTIRFKVELKYGTYFGPYVNSIKAHGIDSLGKYVNDISNNGLIINPSKSDSTIFYIPNDSIDPSSNIKISGGFSPNGDGMNDNLTIKVDGGLEIEQITIVNRWGGTVFVSDNLDRKLELIGWDGRSNRGILVNAGTEFVPSGTYFYHIKVKGYAKPIVSFITIEK